VVLIPLPQLGGGPPKLRPALVLALLPGTFQSVLICGISTRMDNLQANWDEVVEPADGDFTASGLRRRSTIRLSYLYAADRAEIAGGIGRIDTTRFQRLIDRLVNMLRP
jgi:mRNA interferase MazF